MVVLEGHTILPWWEVMESKEDFQEDHLWVEVEDEVEWFAQWMYEWGWQMYLDQQANIEQIWI